MISSEERDAKMLIRFVRIGFVGLMMVVMMLYVLSINQADGDFEVGFAKRWWVPVLTSLILAGVFLCVDMLTPRKKIATITGVMFGLMAGLAATWVLSMMVDLVMQSWDLQSNAIISAIKVLMGVSLAFIGITTVLQTQDEFRLVIPYVEFAKQIRGPRPLLLDTSVLIDARIVDIAATGLIQQAVVIPEFVLAELQTMADSHDRMKRNKGRRGLDMVSKLQRMGTVELVIDSTAVRKKAVDLALVELAETIKALLVTLDTGLARIASIQRIPVLDINTLSNALKPTVIPGKLIRVDLIKPGEQAGQAVGYLDDGTMVVAEDGFEYVGQTRDLVITSSMQTAAGRLLFARVDMADPAYEGDLPGDAGFGHGHGQNQSKSGHDEHQDTDDHEDDHDEAHHGVRPAEIKGPRVVGSPNAKGTPRNPRR
tara:strand:- start:504 stop:1781 length:1278 start_codon:yes stop_codon:yes gene_type:complete